MGAVSGESDVNIELNALKEYHRDFLESLVEDSITQHIDTRSLGWGEYDIAQKSERIAESYSIDWDRL